MGSLPRSLFTHLLEFYRSPPRMVCSAHPTDRTRKPRTYGGGTVGKLVVAIRRSLLQCLSDFLVYLRERMVLGFAVLKPIYELVGSAHPTNC